MERMIGRDTGVGRGIYTKMVRRSCKRSGQCDRFQRECEQESQHITRPTVKR